MLKVALFIILIWPGRPPVVQEVAMPGLDECVEQLALVLERATQHAEKGMTISAACQLAFPTKEADSK